MVCTEKSTRITKVTIESKSISEKMEPGEKEEEPQMEKAKGPSKYLKHHLYGTEHGLHCQYREDKV